MAEIGVYLEGLPAEGLRSFWGDKDGWCTWLVLYKPEMEQNEPALGKLVESTTFFIGLFPRG